MRERQKRSRPDIILVCSECGGAGAPGHVPHFEGGVRGGGHDCKGRCQP